MNEWMSELMDKWMNEWMIELINKWKNGLQCINKAKRYMNWWSFFKQSNEKYRH